MQELKPCPFCNAPAHRHKYDPKLVNCPDRACVAGHYVYSESLWNRRSTERESIEHDAQRYRWLRGRDLETISKGGVFAGLTPDNLVLSEEDLDNAVDEALNQENARRGRDA